jgi:hypothetical protein
LQCLKSLLICAFFYCKDCLKLELNWIFCNFVSSAMFHHACSEFVTKELCLHTCCRRVA